MLIGTELLTSAQMRAIESAATTSGRVPAEILMERAGVAAAELIAARWPLPGVATVLCGPGNNGGDGYVIADRLARAGWRVRVLGAPTGDGGCAAATRARWIAGGPGRTVAPLTSAAWQDAPDPDIVVDAIFGTGLTRPLDGALARLLRAVAAGPAPVVAIDAPSGLCLDSGTLRGHPRGTVPDDMPRATLTIAFDSPRPGHLLEAGPTLCGQLIIADIGLEPFRTMDRAAPTQAVWPPFDVPDRRRRDPAPTAAWLCKQQAGATHKYDHGAALIVAGGPAQGGAARLAARAALRVGAGLVTIAAPRTALPEHAAPPDALMRTGLDDAGDLAELLADLRVRAVCLGPGCGVARADALLPAALGWGGPLVLDADALTAQAPRGMSGLHTACVLTPHGGEFARLFPDLARLLAQDALAGPVASRVDVVRQAAGRAGAVVLLKGPDTVIADPRGQVIVHAAHDVPWLATAGAGDVLSGLICGLMARGLPGLEAAATAARLHATAARRFGPGLIADDLPDTIPMTLRAT